MDIGCGQSEQAAAEAIVDLATQNNSLVVEEPCSPLPSTAILEADENGRGSLQISEQQLHSLSSGDFIEIDGQTYKVNINQNCVASTKFICIHWSYLHLYEMKE